MDKLCLCTSGTVRDDDAIACVNAVNLSCLAPELRFPRPRMPPVVSAAVRPAAGSTILRAAVDYRARVDVAMRKPSKDFCQPVLVAKLVEQTREVIGVPSWPRQTMCQLSQHPTLGMSRNSP
jgi:hypothetical protein